MNIGFTSRIVFAKNYDEERDALAHDWIKFAELIDTTPVPIPNNLTNIGDYISKTNLRAIFLTGGGDCPQSIDNCHNSIDVKRNKTELKIIKFCIENHMPLIGICRGFQILNIYFGGTLTKNIISHENITNSHVNSETTIQLVNGDISQSSKKVLTSVKCFHDDGIMTTDLSQNLISFATAEDGNLIEAFQHKDLPIIGMQWHPERDTHLSSFNKKLIIKFLKEKII